MGDCSWSMQVTALYDYEPEELDELGFWEGDVLRVLRVQDDGWWLGYNVKRPDVVGVFPSNYVQAQRSAPLQQNTKVVVDAVTTPRPLDSSRQRIQLQPRKTPDMPELDDEDENDDKLQELPAEYRGHIGTVLQLRKSLEEAERASEEARDARRQAERERLRHRKSWRGREQDEAEDEDVDHGQQESRDQQLAQVYHQQLEGHSEEDNEDDEELAYPQRQGYMHENHQEEEPQEGAESEKGHNSEEDNDEHREGEQNQAAETAAIENAAATLIAKAYRRHFALFQRNQEREREAEQEKLSAIAAVCIQRWASHAFTRQCKRQRRELEQNTARRRWERENEAAAEIQKWVRMRWACFWLQAEREKQAARESQQAFQREELKKAEHRQAALVEEQRQKAEENRLVAVAEERRRLQQKAEVEQEEEKRRLQDQKREQEKRRELQLKTVEEEVRVQFLKAQEHEEDGNHPAVPSMSTHANSPDKTRRKVMKKEAVDLIKTLVQQQLGETLRDHDAKMDELQRMVARLQTVVRKQTAMLEDSTDQIVNLQMGRHEQRLPVPPRDNEASSASFLPKISSQSTIPRQPAAPSGLRAPRPVILSKLPILIASSGRRASCNQSRKGS